MLPGESSLPAIAAVSAVSAISAAPAAATTMAATATTTAAASSAVSAAPATAAAAFCLRPCFIHHEVAPAKILTIQRIHRAVRVFVVGYFHERESTRLPGETVTDQIDA